MNRFTRYIREVKNKISVLCDDDLSDIYVHNIKLNIIPNLKFLFGNTF